MNNKRVWTMRPDGAGAIVLSGSVLVLDEDDELSEVPLAKPAE